MWARKWRSQRDAYRRSKKDQTTKSGQASAKKTKYKFADQMSFLDDFNFEPWLALTILYDHCPVSLPVLKVRRARGSALQL
jgi:hypothetical protein